MSKEFIDLADLIDDIVDEVNSSVDLNTNKNNFKRADIKSKVVRKETLPFASSVIENAYFPKRYDHFKALLSNLNYGNYSDSKLTGFNSAISHYLTLASNNSQNFKILDQQIQKEQDDCANKKIKNPHDNFLAGYYDGLTVVKKALLQTKLARFQELSNKIK